MKRLSIIAALLVMTASAGAAPPGVTVTPVADATRTVSGQPIEVPANPHVLVTITTIAPGAHLPRHVHPYARYAYILEGTITVTNLETHQTYVQKAGDFVVDLHNQLHEAMNAGSVPVKVLTIDQVPAGVASNMVLK